MAPTDEQLAQALAQLLVVAFKKLRAEPVTLCNPPGETLLLRPADVAKQLGVSRTKVYELLASGEMPSVRIGQSLRVPSAALREWLQDQ